MTTKKQIAMRIMVLVLFITTWVLSGCSKKPVDALTPRMCEGWTTFDGSKVNDNYSYLNAANLHSVMKSRWTESFQVRHPDGGLRNISTCEACLEAAKDGFSGEQSNEGYWGGSTHVNYAYNRVMCQALNLLLETEKPGESYINDVAWDENFAGQLPASIDTEIEKMGNINLKEDDHVHFVEKTKYGMKFKGNVDEYIFDRLAYGDFNHDGIEDLMLYVMFWPPEGHDDYHQEIVIITKLQENAKISILKISNFDIKP